MGVRFYISYDCFKWYFISLTVDTISVENIIVTDGIMTLHAPPRRYPCNVWSYDFYDMTLAMNNSNVIWSNELCMYTF